MDHDTNMTDRSSAHTETTPHLAATAAPGTNPNRNVKVAAGYVLQERLGSGSFATVYKGILLEEYKRAVGGNAAPRSSPPPANSVTAIKAISRASKKLTKKVLENLDMEIAILRTYRHPNIVCLHEVQKTDRHFYLVLEYCAGGDLQRLIRTRRSGRLSERLCRRLVRDLAAGMGFLWGKELVHRDIKPQNLLLTGPLPQEDAEDNPPRGDAGPGTAGGGFALKIADFGFARHLSGVDLAETMCGSPLYMAPEILSGERYDAKADLWSVGAVLFEMIAGKTPFHGENHLDLLRNIKTKAVRLPADVRISREFVRLLKLLLDRKPRNRAGFGAFFEASGALVALGCNGAPAVPPPASARAAAGAANDGIGPSGQRIVEREVCAQMNLCAISENEGAGESLHRQYGDGAASLATVATLGTVDHRQLQQFRVPPSAQLPPVAQGANYVSSMATSQSNALTGVVTPPLNPVSAPQPPPTLPTGLQGAARQHGRPSVFTPLQGSPVFSPSPSPAAPAHPMFSLGGAPDDVGALPFPGTLQPPIAGPFQYRNQGDGAFPTIQQQQMISHPSQSNNQSNTLVPNRRNSIPKTSSHETSDSGFVMVEHSGCRSKPGSAQNSPSTSIGGIPHSPSVSPHNSCNRVTILNERNNMGILGTSPGTGRALVGKMMGSPAKSSTTPPSASGSGRFSVSPRSALRSGGCLAHIDTLARMLATSEDVGRRAITVAHLGDVRAYLAMGLLVAQREDSQLSSMSTGTHTSTPMEGVDEEGNSDTPTVNPKKLPSRKAAAEEDQAEDELPFAMASSSDGGMSHSPSNNMSNVAPIAGKSLDNETPKDEISSTMILVRFREALMCYFKTLTMMKGSICAAQKVMKEVEDVTNLPTGHPSSNNKNPYTPLKRRCSASLEWLRGQFSAVLERADAASEQISKLQKANASQEGGEASICVEELVYNHSLKCGREGAVKQILGHYDVARSCYRSAGLLAETLLMESKVGEDDRVVLEGYIHSFANQILELDGLIRLEMRKSRT